VTAIDRTIYRRMRLGYSAKELIEACITTREERRFVTMMTRDSQHQLNLMLWIKVFPCPDYFPTLGEIPALLMDHIRMSLDLAADCFPGYDHDRTLYCHHQVVREYYQILPYGKEARRVIVRTLLHTVCMTDNLTGMINADPEELIKERFSQSTFCALDRLIGRVRALVYGRICRLVQRCMTADIRHGLEALFEVQLLSYCSAFSQIKLFRQAQPFRT